ncbi:nacht and ankyrin domain protein [Colletotrichum incanum]|uniref:Nacht and ankyrin domain protein n=1 Tax=Colletotrichum incanum TaxID=1573173 RepID=A0A161VZY1_COLIC|nr:nacht and ankyrin domain protein [Colletotrichum incanum]
MLMTKNGGGYAWSRLAWVECFCSPRRPQTAWVDIGGGVPGDVDIRLGDIVVGNKVIQYDMGKVLSGGRIQRTGTLKEPPPIILKAIAQLQAHYERTLSEVPSILGNMIKRYPRLSSYIYLKSLEDRLFRPTYEHDQQPDCHQCSLSELQDRPVRSSRDPKIHYGGIASGNQVVKSARDRDALAKELNIICFEMEAAGLMDIFPCLVIRGICDYADSHKNKQWQPYAAATAAAFAKEFLSIISPNAIDIISTSVQDKRATSTPIPTPQNNEDSSQAQARRADLLELLRFDQLDSRHATIKAAHRQTCAWILRHTSYKEWLDHTKAPQHHGFLWISGKPGAGKSTLMKFAFSNVRRRPDANTAYTSFFFNARGDELEKSTVGLHRSLLLKVLERFPDLQSVLDDPILVPRNQTSCPTTEVLRDLFRNAVMNLSQRRLICFVDALDECEEEQDLGDEATAGGIHLQICFSSRHYPHIEIQNGLKLTLEDQTGHKQDLEKYVRNCLRVGKHSDAEEIKVGVLEKANGVFMWVVLVVDILNKEYGRGRISAARRKLSEIPSRLSKLFRDILRRDNENLEDLLLCIQWILYAKRPLTREEFYFAMLSGLPNEDLTTYGIQKITSDDLDLFVISSSKGLAEITKSKNVTVQFIHESVRDFLIKDNGLQELWPQLGEQFQSLSHDKLKECCHSYMNFVTSNTRTTHNSEALPKANSDEAKELRRKTLGNFPFLGYATEYVLHHGDLGAIAASQLGFLDQFPLQAWIRFTNLLEKHQVRCYTSRADLTYILAERNLVRLLELRMKTNPHVHVAGERYGFPMIAALANGHLLAAKTLLGQAAGLQDIEELFTGLDNKRG